MGRWFGCERDEGGKDVVVSYQVLRPSAWARVHFGQVQLGDKRLNDRVIEVARRMVVNPSASIPRQSRAWKTIKGAYRLFDHERASFEALSAGHWQQTRQQCASGSGVVLLIQDTTWLDYSAHRKTQGLPVVREEPQESSGRQRAVPTQRAGGSTASSGTRTRSGDRSDARQAVGAQR